MLSRRDQTVQVATNSAAKAWHPGHATQRRPAVEHASSSATLLGGGDSAKQAEQEAMVKGLKDARNDKRIPRESRIGQQQTREHRGQRRSSRSGDAGDTGGGGALVRIDDRGRVRLPG